MKLQFDIAAQKKTIFITSGILNLAVLITTYNSPLNKVLIGLLLLFDVAYIFYHWNLMRVRDIDLDEFHKTITIQFANYRNKTKTKKLSINDITVSRRTAHVSRYRKAETLTISDAANGKMIAKLVSGDDGCEASELLELYEAIPKKTPDWRETMR